MLDKRTQSNNHQAFDKNYLRTKYKRMQLSLIHNFSDYIIKFFFLEKQILKMRSFQVLIILICLSSAIGLNFGHQI